LVSNQESKDLLNLLKKVSGLRDDELQSLASGGLDLSLADVMSENVIGTMAFPIGLAKGLIINGRERLIPMVSEQRNIITMVMKGAELTRGTGGFVAESTEPYMVGQIQILDVESPYEAAQQLQSYREEILRIANSRSRTRSAIDIESKVLETSAGRMLIVELIVDVKDSMGANVVNSMCEATAPRIEAITGGRVILRVLSNLSTRRLVKAMTTVDREVVGDENVEKILQAQALAEVDPYRAATHNKGILNGVISVLMATSNDTRAIEAGAHAYAALSGAYSPLSRWALDDGGNLVGELTLPMAVGILGGSVSTHPTVRTVLKIMGVKTANELGEMAASVGLSSNLGALYALVTEGITAL
jgi:hydroxymethylglutaryl-CoA reductase